MTFRYGAPFAPKADEIAPQVFAPPVPSDEPPRRCRLDMMVPAELAITKAMEAVELAGCDPWLTDAVVLLQQARNKVADYVDGLEARRQQVQGVANQGAR